MSHSAPKQDKWARPTRAGYYLTFWRLGDYYRTYPEYVEDETVNVLKERSDFMHGGSIGKPFVVEDGNLITARYPEDAYLFAQKLLARVTMHQIEYSSKTAHLQQEHCGAMLLLKMCCFRGVFDLMHTSPL